MLPSAEVHQYFTKKNTCPLKGDYAKIWTLNSVTKV